MNCGSDASDCEDEQGEPSIAFDGEPDSSHFPRLENFVRGEQNGIALRERCKN